MSRKASGKPKIYPVKKLQKNGDIYVYERTSVYDPEKRYYKSVSSKLIGKIPAGTTEMTSTRPRKKSSSNIVGSQPITASAKLVGLTDILDWIGRTSGIDDAVYNCTDKGTAQKIISIARYWMANPGRAIPEIEEWQIDHVLPYEEGISSDICYQLMKDVGQTPSIAQNYFASRAAASPSKASVALDSSTIYSYSEHLNDVRYGYNKDRNGLPTIKLMTLYCIETRQPIAFTRQPGNIPDVISVENALKQLSIFGMNRPMIVMDNGFYSEDNIFGLIRNHIKFLMKGDLDAKWIHPELNKCRNTIKTPSNESPDFPGIFGTTVPIEHEFTRERKYTRAGVEKGEILHEKHRLYLHFFYDSARAELTRTELMRSIRAVMSQLSSGVDTSLLSPMDQTIMDKYIVAHRHGDKLTFSLNDEAIIKAGEDYGYIVLVANKKLTAAEALTEYRLREKTEEGFRLDKGVNDAHSTRSKTGASLEGRLFCQFVAYGYEEYFAKALKDLKSRLAVKNGDHDHDLKQSLKDEESLRKWIDKMSVAKLLNWFDAVQETTVATAYGKRRWRTESIERDKLFLRLLGVIRPVG